jgi:hypothetical protein
VGCAHSDFCGKVVREMAALREEMRAAHGKSDGDAGGGCAMCEREMHLTHHHLIPRCEHELMLKRGASKVHPRPLPTHTAMCKLRIGRLGFGTGRQKPALERGTTPTLSRRTCIPPYGLQSC